MRTEIRSWCKMQEKKQNYEVTYIVAKYMKYTIEAKLIYLSNYSQNIFLQVHFLPLFPEEQSPLI